MAIFEYDREANALYLYFREIPDGAVARTVELAEGVYLDADAEGRTLGVEFLDLEDYNRWLARNNGVGTIPQRVGSAKASDFSPV